MLASPSPTAREGGRLTIGVYQDATLLNPILAVDPASSLANGLIFSRLMTYRADGALVGDLAERWEVSPDGRRYTFTLHDGVKFHDGNTLTSEDVRFTYATILKPETQSPRRPDLLRALAGPESISAPDRRTVVFELRDPYAPFLGLVAIWGIVPQYILGEFDPSELRTAPFNTGPIGTGPFRFVGWQRGGHLVLERHPDYFGGRPLLDGITLQVVRESTTMGTLLRGGTVDWAEVDVEQMAELERVPLLRVVGYDNFTQIYLGFQLDPARPSPVQDAAVRQALLLAIDRPGLVRTLLDGQGSVPGSLYPPPSWAFHAGSPPPFPHDPELARQILDSAGWKVPAGSTDGVRQKAGKALRFYLYVNAGNRLREAYAAALEEAWRQIGVDAIAKPEEFPQFRTRLARTHDFEVFLAGFVWTPDPDESAMWATSSYPNGYNFGRYSNPRVDELLAQANRALDRQRRLELLREAERLIWADLPAVPLVFQRTVEALNRRVQGVQPNPYNPTYDAHRWWLSPIPT